MDALLLVLFFGSIFGLGRILPCDWAGTFTSRRTVFESWAAQSRLFIFGLPIVLALGISVLGRITESGSSVTQMFGSGFIGFIIFSLFLSGSRVTHVRLGIKMAFITCVFGVIFSLILR
ncbi:MAG: hypothetical protein Q8T09_08395 [Candidatus Melainabacteria bacterium]|nr:hypothetical protein [Candidatus Melainabacteria bacterium]